MSATTGNRSGTRGFTRKVLVIPALVAFLAVDIVLIALALGWGGDQLQATGPDSPTLTASPAKDDHGTVDDGVTPSPSTDAEPNSLYTSPRLLSAASDSVAWRSEGGSCNERGSLELTIDGGETWGAAYPTLEGPGQSLWVSGADHSSVQSVIASGADCGLEGLRSFDSGASWADDDQVITNSVMVDPNDPSELIWGGERLSAPCQDVNNVAVTRGVASAVCSDGSLWSVSSESAEWVQTDVENAIGVAGSDGRWIASVDARECNGLQLVEFSDVSVETLACMPIESQSAPAMDLTGDTLWLWAEDEILILFELGRSLNS